MLFQNGLKKQRDLSTGFQIRTVSIVSSANENSAKNSRFIIVGLVVRVSVINVHRNANVYPIVAGTIQYVCVTIAK